MIVSVSSAYELKKKKHEIPLKIKMFYTFCLTRISGQVFFFTACSISGLEGKARKYIVIQSFGYTAVRASKSTTIGVVNKRDWRKKKRKKERSLCSILQSHSSARQFITSQAQEESLQSLGLSSFQHEPGGNIQSFLLQACNLPELQPCALAKQQEEQRELH